MDKKSRFHGFTLRRRDQPDATREPRSISVPIVTLLAIDGALFRSRRRERSRRRRPRTTRCTL
jgi:hypothetical protein